MLLGTQDCSLSLQNGLENQSFSTCFQALFLRHTPPRTHWAITASGYRSGSISGVNSHARVSSSFPAALFYLPCFLQAMKQSRHLKSAVCADLVHPSCKAGNRSSLNPSLPERPYQHSWWPRIVPRRLSPQLYRTAMVLQGEDNSTAFCFLSYSSKRPLADMLRHSPGTRSYSNIVPWVPVASCGTTQCMTLEVKCIFQTCPKLPKWCAKNIQRIQREDNIAFLFSFKPSTGGSCIALLSWIWYVQQRWLLSLKASKCAYWKILVTNFYLNRLHIWASIMMRLAYSFFILHLMRKGVKVSQIQIWRIYSVFFFNKVDS